MVTPDGYLYSREALLENLLQQKKAIKKKTAAYEAQQQDELQKVGQLSAVWLLVAWARAHLAIAAAVFNRAAARVALGCTSCRVSAR
jgi:nitric oxide synthase-interacting protein